MTMSAVELMSNAGLGFSPASPMANREPISHHPRPLRDRTKSVNDGLRVADIPVASAEEMQLAGLVSATRFVSMSGGR